MTNRPGNIWSGVSIAVTHTGLTVPGALEARHHDRTAVITRNQVRAVTLVLSGHDPATTAAVQERFGWPVWEAPAVPVQDQDWKAVFHSADRTFEGFYNESAQSTDPKTVRLPRPTRLTDEMWQMLERTGGAVMCIGLEGAPTLQDIASAIRQCQFHAAVVEALVR
ncbi:hypothetical protein ABT263_35910 [Kitasatospora sp. NPDC001603]|uniref:hypothetical protein n=1 Tax=Kitasatospora sp. NPDC001603 TaxID=3154388 RepID=UPI00332EC7CA